MSLRAATYVRDLIRRVIASLQSEVMILLYHNILDAWTDPQRLCVSPKNFAEHLEHLSNNYPVLSLKDLRLALRKRRLPKRAVVLTFDDGYVDLLLNAKPLLSQHGIPATAFLATGYIGHDKEFWWDELERLLLLSRKLPERLTLTVDGKRYTWQMDNWATLTDKNLSDYRMWHVESDEAPTHRHRTYLQIYHLLQALQYEKLSNALSELRRQVGNVEECRADYRALRPDEISELADDGLIEIGAHTVTHPMLSKLPIRAQRQEIVESKQQLETILGRPVTSFAYPYGGFDEIGPNGPKLVEEAGYESACAVFDAPVTVSSNPYLLPRIDVLNWNGPEFSRHLERFFNPTRLSSHDILEKLAERRSFRFSL